MPNSQSRCWNEPFSTSCFCTVWLRRDSLLPSIAFSSPKTLEGTAPATPEWLSRSVDDFYRLLASKGLEPSPEEIKPVHLCPWLAYLQERGLAKSTINTKYRALSSYISLCLAERTIKDSPLKNIEPPIPFTSVIFAFIFMFPMYFVAQFYSASIMNERTNRSGEFLLTSPLTKREIVAGKTLPYLITTIGIMFVLAMYLKYTLGSASIPEIVKNSIVIVAVMLPVVSLFLSFSLFSSILARSFKELTFVSVFFSTIVSGYLFFPAMFAHIHAIALISPMTLVVKILTGTEICLSEYLFSTVPFYCVSIATFGFATLIFREEDLFTQKTVKRKIIDCIELFLRKRSYLFLLTLIFIPFAYMFELMSIVLLFNIPLPYSIIAMVCISALIEEVLKSAGVYTLSLKGYTGKQAIILAILAGSGFFVGEKLMMLVTVASIADSVFGTVLSMGSLLVYPLLLHIGCVAIVAIGLRYQRYSVCLLAATAVHVAYNFFLLRGVIFA